MTFVAYPNISAVSPTRRFRIEISGKPADGDFFRDQSDFAYALFDAETGAQIWRWRPSELEGLADFPHEAWVDDDGWVIARLHSWFHAGILVLSPKGECRMLRPIQSLDGEAAGLLEDESDDHIGGTSAGPTWEASSIACFHRFHHQPFWSIRTWWGRRIVIHLAAGEPLSEWTEAQERVMAEAEGNWALSQLKRSPLELAARDDACPRWWQRVAGPIYSAAFHAGALGLQDAIPLLRDLETNQARGYSTSASWLDIVHLPFRLIAKVALLQLGIEPQWAANFELTNQQTGLRCSYPQERLGNHTEIHEGASQRELLESVGVPEFMRNTWEYWFYQEGSPFSYHVHWHDKHKPPIDWRNTSNVRAKLDAYGVAVEREPPVAERVVRIDGPPWVVDSLQAYTIAHHS